MIWAALVLQAVAAEPDSRILTDFAQGANAPAIAAYCLGTAERFQGADFLNAIEDYGKRHRLTPAEISALMDRCILASAAATHTQLRQRAQK